ncbi:MAG: Nif3-like dinuclear metal center hexameric protein [Bryobacteraceae bacterium]
MEKELTGRTAELMLRAALGNPMTTAIYEGLCAGNPQSAVHGIAVCYAPTVEVLRRAAAQRRTLILSREHPLFLHGGLHYAYTSGGLEVALKDDPVANAKRDLISANRLMVLRFGGAWDVFRSKAASLALAKAMGLTPVEPLPTDRARGVVCEMPRTKLAALAQIAFDRLKAAAPRIVGDPDASVTRVAVLAGETDPSPALAQLLADHRIDGLIAGAGGTVDEVDGAIAYFRDVVATGRRIAMLAVGYGPSQEPGVADFASWVAPVFPTHPAAWWPTPDPSWIPR